jgi:hypothetical protein
MNLSMVVYDSNGATRGQLRMQLDFAGTKWSVLEDASLLWKKIGASPSGGMTVSGTEVGLKDQPAGKVILQLLNLPQNGSASAGTGKIVAASDPALSSGFVFWAAEQPKLSPIRATMIALLNELVNKDSISSDDPQFKKINGYNTQMLLDNHWEPENKKNPPWDPRKMPKKDTNFTTCNLTLGAIAIKLGAKLGKPTKTWLTRGPLQLDLVDKDVPGCWISKNTGATPQAGDFYSINHGAQVFGHVGIIAEIKDDGTWVSIDGGQGGYKSANKKDFIKRVPRGKLDPMKLNGWIDIDKYFA